MSQNDLIHLESNFKNWTDERGKGLKKVDPFVFYCVDQFLKPFNLNDEEILYGITDGANDGGVDAIYFLVNRGELVRDDTDIDPKGVSKASVIIVQVKSNNGFKMTEIEKLLLFTDDLLDLSLKAATLTTKYHAALVEIMRVFKEKYLLIAGRFPAVNVAYYYITKGDELTPDSKATEAADKIKRKVFQHLNKAQCSFRFVNAQGLEQIRQRPPKERTLIWAETPMQTTEGYVGLVKLKDYYPFIMDEGGGLADQIFESNVRGFQQKTTINKQIRESLRTFEQQANFWLLNNGITVIATRAQNAGNKILKLEDPQIVNGLQTSREIFNYFSEESPTTDERSVLVRVIETGNEVVRDAVIKATNSQNKMPASSLRATDPIHHQIEDLFKQYDVYYDRRKGFYKDKGKPIERIVSVIELVQAVVSVFLQRPDDARARPSDYLKDDSKYESIFGQDRLPLGLYLLCAALVRRADESLLGLERGDRRNVKFYVTMYLACRLTKHPSPSTEHLMNIDVSEIQEETVEDCFRRVWKRYVELGQSDTISRGPELLRKLGPIFDADSNHE